VLRAFGAPLRVEEVELEPPRAGEVLVRYAASGVCHSDLHAAQGVHPTPLPAILGHEGAGVVEAVGAGVTDVAPGDGVVLSWLPSCGRCRWCAQGRPTQCERLAWSDAGTMRDGTTRFRAGGEPIHHFTGSSFAEAAVVPADTAIPVGDDLPLERLALLGCAVTTGVLAVLRTAAVPPGATVAVVGCGGVGLNVVQGARIAGASRIVAVDRVPAKLSLARTLGATDAVDASAGDPRAAVSDLVPGGVDYAFEAIGRPDTIELATRVLGRCGTAVLVGKAPPDARVPIDALTVTMREQRILGCWYGTSRPALDIPLLVDLVRQGRLALDPLVGATCGLDGIDEAFRRMERGDVARTLVVYR
jgi:S-(hydroxymethyl)glutathione dehydrogenase/alcohol dehydrogenase